jgi:O-antigen/teichoic acid export membrane protein
MPGQPGEDVAAAPHGTAVSGIARNTVYAFLAQITTGVFTTVLTLYLLRALGSDRYGVFALALGIGALAAVAPTGVSQSAARFLAERRDQHGVVSSILRDALALHCLVGGLLTAVLLVAASPIAAAYGEPELTWPLRAVALAVFVQSVFAFYTTALEALARVATKLRLIFFESLAETGSSIVLVALGAGVVGAVLGRAAGYLVGLVLAAAAVVRLFDRWAIGLLAADRRRMLEIARYAVPLLVIAGAYAVYAQANVLIIGALLGTTAVGLFAAPLLLVVPLRYLGQSLAVSVAPRQVRPGREPGSVRAFLTSLRWMIIYQAALLAPLIVWADPIVELLFGAEYQESADVLRGLAPYIFLTGLSPLLSNTVTYLGQAARRIPIVVAALAVNVALNFALLPWIGIVGAAIATSVSYALYVPAHFRICRRELGFSIRPLGATLTRAVVAAAGMGLVLFAFGTGSLSVAAWVAGGSLGVLVFCSLLVLTGEVGTGELRRGAAVVTSAMNRARRR